MVKSICQVLGFIVVLSYVAGVNPIFSQKIPVLRFLPKISISPPEIYQQKPQAPPQEKSSLPVPQPTPSISSSPSPNPSPKGKRWGIEYKFKIGENVGEK